MGRRIENSRFKKINQRCMYIKAHMVENLAKSINRAYDLQRV